MELHTLKVGQKVYFLDETLPFNVLAVSDRYAVVSRKIDRKEDEGLLEFEVKRRASRNINEAWTANKKYPVYSILDFKEGVRGPDNMIFGDHDYFKPEDCERAIKELEDENSSMEISHRNRVGIDIVAVWEKD